MLHNTLSVKRTNRTPERRWIVLAGLFGLATIISTSSQADPSDSREGTIARQPALSQSPVVTTQFGKIQGEVDGQSHVFRGIPYAMPPEGSNRWQPPKETDAWPGVLLTTEFGSICPQGTKLNLSGLNPESDEDCLTINIATPIGAKDLPVLVSIHGGAFRAGSGQFMFSAAPILNREGVILVTINYRLGALGFFAHPQLPAEQGVNYGLMDMIAALEWVRDNISSFGGDPSRVTIEGVSAGAQAVHMLMIAPKSEDLFAGAIAQSGYGAFPGQPRLGTTPSLPGTTAAEELGLEIAGRAAERPPKTLTRDDLYAITPEQFLRTARGFQLPIIDGTSLPEETAIEFARGSQHRVPFIGGGTSFDGSIFPYTGITAEQALKMSDGQVEKVKALYKDDFNANEDQGISRFFGDIRYVYAGWNATRAMHALDQPGYLYLFDYVKPEDRDKMPGAGHGTGFMTLWFTPDLPFAETMRAYWINFVKTGSPNGKGLVHWPRANAGAVTRWLVLGEPILQADNLKREKMLFLDELWRKRTQSTLPTSRH